MLLVRVSPLYTLKNQSKFFGGKSRLTPMACGSLIKSWCSWLIDNDLFIALMTTSCHGIKKELLESALDCESSWVFIPVFIQISSAKFVPFESGCSWTMNLRNQNWFCWKLRRDLLYEDVHLSRLLHIFVIWTNVFARKDQEIRFCHEKFKEELELWRLTQNHNTIMILRQPPMSHKQKSKK